METSNRHPMDRLADIRSEIGRLEEQERSLKGSIRTCTTVGRRSSWRRTRNGSPATRRARRPRTRSRSSRLRRASSRRPWLRS
jgi:hypothetical protein